MSSNLLITDAGPLSYFHHGGIFAVLQPLFGGRLYVSSTVLREVRQDDSVAQSVNLAVEAGWLLPVAPDFHEITLAARLVSQRIHAGESESLAIASNRRWILVCDDRRAREAAKESEVESVGSMGLLYKAVAAGLLTVLDADRAIDLMRAAKQRLPDGTYRYFEEQIRQQKRDKWLESL